MDGPPAIPIFGTTWFFKKDPVEMVKQVQGWFNDYTLSPGSNGLLKVWMGPIPVICICRGETAKIVFDSSINITKSSQYQKLKQWIGDGLLIRAPLNWLKPIWYIFGNGFEFNKHVKLTTDFTREVIENRKKFLENEEKSGQDDSKKLAFLDHLLYYQSEHPDILTDEGIREEVDTFMFEGHDTTSSGITFALWFLGQFPEYQNKVQDELDEIFGDDFERCPNSEDIQRMVFLEQCIKETLRVTPPVPFISRKLEEDVVIPSATGPPVLLPAGLNVIINIITIMKDARYFERPYDFYPDHFSPERVKAREAFAFVPFSAGPRNCIGQKFALLEEKVVLSWIFRYFTVISMTKFADERIIPELILKPQNGTQVLLKSRRKL